jgi:hypothetical protein
MAVVESYPEWPARHVTLPDDPEEREKSLELFNSFLTIRAPADWRGTSDTIILARAAMTMVEIDRYEIQLRQTGPLIRGGKSGNTPVQNPIAMHVSWLYGKFRQLANHVGLSHLPNDSRALGSNAKSHAEATDVISKAKSDIRGLLA